MILLPNFRGDGKTCAVLSLCEHGMTYDHPTLGVCSRRYEDLDSHEVIVLISEGVFQL